MNCSLPGQESFVQALEISTIIPKIFQDILRIHQNILGRARIFQERRAWLERFLLKETNHPLHPEKMKDFNLLLEDYINNPTLDRSNHILRFADNDFLQELENALIIPAECEDEIFYVEKLKRCPAGIEEEKKHLNDFFSRYAEHPLFPTRIQSFIATVREIKSVQIPEENLIRFVENRDRLHAIITATWLKNGYYPNGLKTTEANAEADREIEEDDKEAIEQLTIK